MDSFRLSVLRNTVSEGAWKCAEERLASMTDARKEPFPNCSAARSNSPAIMKSDITARQTRTAAGPGKDALCMLIVLIKHIPRAAARRERTRSRDRPALSQGAALTENMTPCPWGHYTATRCGPMVFRLSHSGLRHTRSLSILRPSTSTTSMRQLPSSKCSPSRGSVSIFSSTSPATVA